MKIKNTKLSRRTLALLAVTAMLFAGGSYTGTRAALTYFSNDYVGAFELNHIHVHLVENGTDVCHEKNDIFTVHRGNSNDGTDADQIAEKDQKYRGNLVEYLGYKNDKPYDEAAAYTLGTPGKVEPGRTYKEEISARNGTKIDEYVRLTVRKYWVKDGKAKDTRLDPDLIKLTYGDKAYNSSAWKLNKEESTPESETYYLKKVLPSGKDSALLFDSLTIDKEVANLANEKTTTTEKTENGEKVTVITYEYDYNGYTFFIEAEVQALQTHNVNDAIGSIWGVKNVTASNGKVTVK